MLQQRPKGRTERGSSSKGKKEGHARLSEQQFQRTVGDGRSWNVCEASVQCHWGEGGGSEEDTRWGSQWVACGRLWTLLLVQLSRNSVLGTVSAPKAQFHLRYLPLHLCDGISGGTTGSRWEGGSVFIQLCSDLPKRRFHLHPPMRWR